MKNKPLILKAKKRWAIPSIYFVALASLIKADDVMRFTNADQLHGSFQGIDDQGKISWQRRDFNANSLVSPTDVRSIALGNQQQKSAEYSFIRLSNGDIIPGSVVHLSDKLLKIKGAIIGEMEMPREHVREICPAPFAGRIHYLGPFSSEGWSILYPPSKEKLTDTDKQADAKPQAEKLPNKDKEAENQEPAKDPAESKLSEDEKHWKHIGSSWIRKDSAHTLIRKDCLPKSSLLRFRAKWRSRINLNIVINADFMTPPEKKEEDLEKEGAVKKNAMAGGLIFQGSTQQIHLPSLGNAIVLNIYQSYLSLSRVGYKKNGEFFINRLTQAASALQLEESGDSIFEIRSDLASGLMMLFVDGKYAAQWEELSESDDLDLEDSDKMLPLGNGIGFQVTGNKLPLCINDIVIADWNGVRDPARSFTHAKRDVLLLTNGMDRYSGTLDSIQEGNAIFQSSLGKLQIPLSDLSEIHFAGSEDETTNQQTASSIGISFFPLGKISGQAVRGDRKEIQLKHPLAGDLKLNLDQASLLHFSDENSFIDELFNDENAPLNNDE